jgi:uncharacterized protein DUF4325
MSNPTRGPERFRVADHGTFLATRESGRRARLVVERRLATLPAEVGVALDFGDVEAIAGPFADELVANLVLAYAQRISVQGANDDVREVIDRAIERRR